MTRDKLYFGHPINTYNTSLELELLSLMPDLFPMWEIENPNQQKHQDGYKKFGEEKGNGMLYFTEVVLPACGGGVFLPFRDGKLGAGIAKEALCLLDKDLPCWEIALKGALAVVMDLSKDDFMEDRVLSVEETRARLRDAEGNLSI